MWNPKRIEIYNLFAHVESVYKFRNNTCTVIYGRNDTDRGLENNGAGKSTLFEAISIALTNESLRDINKESFINREAESCKIVFELENPFLKMSLKIVRQFFRGNKSAKIEVWENGAQNRQVTSVNEANKRVLELIGLSREDLLRYYIISQDSSYTFFTARDAEKKEILNRITSADMINPILDELTARQKEVQANINETETEIEGLTAKRELLEEQIAELSEASNEEEIKELEEQIAENIVSVENLIEAGKALKKKKKGFESAKQKIEVKDYSVLTVDKTTYQKEYDKISDSIIANNKMRKKIDLEISGAITCPKCSTRFIPDSTLGITVREGKHQIERIDRDNEEKSKELMEKESIIKKLKKDIAEAQELERAVDELNDEIDNIDRKIKRNKRDQEDLLSLVESYVTKLEELKSGKGNENAINKLTNRLKENKKELDEVTEKLLPLTSELEMIKFWQFNFGRSGFTTYLANKSIKVIEGATNSFLKKFKVDISVLINGFTVLRSQEVREKIDVFITSDGLTAEPFMGKSGGERGRVMLAGILGIQKLINMSTNGLGLNLLCFDECFHGMDSRGQENIIKIFERMGATILVITQNVSDKFNNENKLFVVKESGISRYV